MTAQTVTPAETLASDVRQAATEVAEPTVALESLTEIDTRQTNRWFGVTGVALVIAGLGVMMSRPSLLVVSLVGIWYGMYYRVFDPPEPDLEIERQLSDPLASPGSDVRVKVSVTNVGDSFLPDIRLVDGVPPAISVTTDEPRRATALRPGQTATFTYTIETRRGHHLFDPMTIIVRDIAGANEVEYEAEVPSILHCDPEEGSLPPLPLRQLTRNVTGRVETRQGGSGLEFYATREYRPGDALNRIDWNRKARTGELSTLEFREEQAATVILVIDVRPEAYVAAPDQEIPAADIGIDAAADVFFSLLDAGDRVGLTTLGERDCWLPPGLGTDHRASGRILFGGHPSLGPKPPTEHISVDYQRWQLEHRLPMDAQIIYISPFADDGAERYATMLDARGHLVTAISPDPTGRETPGQSLATVERSLRLRRLRDRGIRVVDWDTDRSLAVSIEEAAMRW